MEEDKLNTNVRTQSDVDIAVVEEDTFRTQYRSGVSDSNYGFVNAPSRSKKFKDEIEEALKDKFGTDVSRENKSIKIYGNTYRKDAEYLFSIYIAWILNQYSFSAHLLMNQYTFEILSVLFHLR